MIYEKSQKRPIKPTKKAMQILKVLGKSERPLSSREIEKEILGLEKVNKKKRDPDVYRVIKNELCIRKFDHDFFLFDWNKLLSTIDEKLEVRKNIDLKRVVENLNTISLKLNESTVEFNKKKVVV